MTEIKTNEDWKWYKRRLDLEREYEHRHVGAPDRLPCKVKSTFFDDPNGPYTYEHEFVYQKEVTCTSCGHKVLTWDV